MRSLRPDDHVKTGSLAWAALATVLAVAAVAVIVGMTVSVNAGVFAGVAAGGVLALAWIVAFVWSRRAGREADGAKDVESREQGS